MRTTWWTLLLLSIGLVASGCPTAGDDDDSGTVDDDDDSVAQCAGILGTSPEPGDDGVFTSKISVTWDAVPENGNLTVADDAGAAVTGNIVEDDNGRTLIFDAGAAFAAQTATGTKMLTIYPGIAETANVSVSDVLPKTWRVVATQSGSTSMTYSISAILIP